MLGSGHWRDLVPRRPAGINVTTPLAGVEKLCRDYQHVAAASMTEPGADTITEEASVRQGSTWSEERQQRPPFLVL